MPREALIVTFAAPLPTAFSTRLRGAGLRWNKVLHHWEGVANFDTIAATGRRAEWERAACSEPTQSPIRYRIAARSLGNLRPVRRGEEKCSNASPTISSRHCSRRSSPFCRSSSGIPAWRYAHTLWGDALLGWYRGGLSPQSTIYQLAYAAWPSVALVGPAVTMVGSAASAPIRTRNAGNRRCRCHRHGRCDRSHHRARSHATARLSPDLCLARNSAHCRHVGFLRRRSWPADHHGAASNF